MSAINTSRRSRSACRDAAMMRVQARSRKTSFVAQAMTLLITLLLPSPNVASPLASELLVLASVPKAMRAEVDAAMTAILEESKQHHEVIEIDEHSELSSSQESRIDRSAARLVALGANACRRLADIGRTATCALLSAEAFTDIDCGSTCDRLEAVIMDQPLDRQMAVANGVYPALGNFGLISARSADTVDIRQGSDSKLSYPAGTHLDYQRYLQHQTLIPQVERSLANNDALLTQAESTIFDRSALNVVLLTAYGNSKPVIGYSRAFVKAGALISAYSTPAQVLREVLVPPEPRDRSVNVRTGNRSTARRMRTPLHFSVAENPRIAMSLGLVKRREIDPTKDYIDADFSS